MSGHHAQKRSQGANHAPAADHRLDQFAAQITEARANTPALAALDGEAQQLIDAALDIAGHLDPATLGAAWILLGQILFQRLQLTPPEAQPSTLGALFQAARLAGVRLYNGDQLPVEMRCPFTYGTGAPCKTVIKAPNAERVDVLLGAHVWQQHPGESWPPKPEVYERSISPQALGVDELAPPPAGWREIEPSTPLEARHGRQFERDDTDGEDGTAYCACGKPAELIVGETNRPDGQPGTAKAVCMDCARAGLYDGDTDGEARA